MRTEINSENITVYKWIKIIEYIILIVLGALLAIIGYFSDGVSNSLSYALGVILVVFGTMNIVSGYLLFRSALCQDVATGTVSIGFAVVLFYLPDLLQQIISIFLITCMYVISVMFILNGIDHLGVFKDSKKNVRTSVLDFILSAFLVALASVYLYFHITQAEQIQKIMIIIVGGILIVAGIGCIVNLLKKVKNTNEMLLEQEVTKEETYNTSDEVMNTDVKVVDINDLKKEDRKKNRKRQNTQTQLVQVVEEKTEVSSDQTTTTDTAEEA